MNLRTFSDFGRVALLLLCVGGLYFGASCQPGEQLAAELKKLSTRDGLTVLRVRFNWIETPLGGTHADRNPRWASPAWFSVRGDFIAWMIFGSPDHSRVCPGSIVVSRRDGSTLWQLPGTFVANDLMLRALGVSYDGKRVALYGSYNPGLHPSAYDTVPKELSVQWSDATTMRMTKVGESLTGDDDVGSISWAPDGNSFVFDRLGKILIYSIASNSVLPIANGSDPTWSPDGTRIAFRTVHGKAATIDRRSFRITNLLGDQDILSSVQWSPDSKYVLVSQPANSDDRVLHLDPTETGIMRVYRLTDLSSLTIGSINHDSYDSRGRWFSWIVGYRDFLRGAQSEPTVQPCLPAKNVLTEP